MSVNPLTQTIPFSQVAYDADDDVNPYFITNGVNSDAGLVAAPSINVTSANPSAKLNANDWSVAYTPSSYSLPPAHFFLMSNPEKNTQKSPLFLASKRTELIFGTAAIR